MLCFGLVSYFFVRLNLNHNLWIFCSCIFLPQSWRWHFRTTGDIFSVMLSDMLCLEDAPHLTMMLRTACSSAEETKGCLAWPVRWVSCFLLSFWHSIQISLQVVNWWSMVTLVSLHAGWSAIKTAVFNGRFKDRYKPYKGFMRRKWTRPCLNVLLLTDFILENVSKNFYHL